MSLKCLCSRRVIIVLVLLLTACGAALFVDPYTRQLVFGPTVRGKPRCAWEDAIRRQAGEQNSLRRSMFHWLRISDAPHSLDELYDNPEMVPIIRDLLDDPNPRVRSTCVFAVKFFPSLQDPTLLPGLRRSLLDEDIEIRIPAAEAVWHIDKSKDSLVILLEALDGPDPDARFLAAGSLGKISAHLPELYAPLVKHASDPEARVRIEVIAAMRNFGDKGLQVLVGGISDPSPSVRLTAIGIIQELKSTAKEAHLALESRLNDPEPDVSQAAWAALEIVAPARYEHHKKIGGK